MRLLPYLYLLIPGATVFAHHDGTGTPDAGGSPYVMIGVGVIFVAAVLWIVFAKPKK